MNYVPRLIILDAYNLLFFSKIYFFFRLLLVTRLRIKLFTTFERKKNLLRIYPNLLSLFLLNPLL